MGNQTTVHLEVNKKDCDVGGHEALFREKLASQASLEMLTVRVRSQRQITCQQFQTLTMCACQLGSPPFHLVNCMTWTDIVSVPTSAVEPQESECGLSCSCVSELPRPPGNQKTSSVYPLICTPGSLKEPQPGPPHLNAL